MVFGQRESRDVPVVFTTSMIEKFNQVLQINVNNLTMWVQLHHKQCMVTCAFLNKITSTDCNSWDASARVTLRMTRVTRMTEMTKTSQVSGMTDMIRIPRVNGMTDDKDD